jgi:uncharacterized protein
MSESTLKRIDWNLLMLAAAEGQRLQPVQMQKVLFLFGKGLSEAAACGYYDFHPYNYGAFDPAVYWDAEKLASQGLASVTRVGPSGWREFAATLAGLERAAEVSKRADPRTVDYLRRLVHWARNLSFPDLVRAVYKAHPETRANSIFRDEA